MIVLFTDFGQGPYTGQMIAAIREIAPEVAVISLFDDLPPFNIKAAAYLLPAYAQYFPEGSIFVCVVDPGVGGDRAPIIVDNGKHRFVGPDNGLFEILARRSPVTAERITWQPERLSASFHGRDLFAPVASKLLTGAPVGTEVNFEPRRKIDWPDDLDEVIYIDGYGNAITGRRAETLDTETDLVCEGAIIAAGSVFSGMGAGQLFWHANSNGLVELSVCKGSVVEKLGLSVGDPIKIAAFSE